jgi:hypothetical protein
MNPLPDRTVIVGILATVGVVFALVFWFVRLSPSVDPPMLWKEQPRLEAPIKPAHGSNRPGSLI